MKQAQLKQPIVIITDPFIACWRFVMPLIWLLLLFPCVQNNSSTGPFINVMTIAPATVATVPNILAWLRMLLIFNFSSLGRSIEFDRTKESLSKPHVYGYLVYLATRFLKNHCKGWKLILLTQECKPWRRWWREGYLSLQRQKLLLYISFRESINFGQ